MRPVGISSAFPTGSSSRQFGDGGSDVGRFGLMNRIVRRRPLEGREAGPFLVRTGTGPLLFQPPRLNRSGKRILPHQKFGSTENLKSSLSSLWTHLRRSVTPSDSLGFQSRYVKYIMPRRRQEHLVNKPARPLGVSRIHRFFLRPGPSPAGHRRQ